MSEKRSKTLSLLAVFEVMEQAEVTLESSRCFLNVRLNIQKPFLVTVTNNMS